MSSQERNQIEQKQSKAEESINTKDFLIGALIGGMVGAAAALFLTPKSGKELRSDINEQASALKEKSDQIRVTAMTKGTELAAVAKEKTNAFSQTVSKQSTELANKVKNLKSSINGQADISLEENSLVTNNDEVQTKLEETKKAFDETEKQYN